MGNRRDIDSRRSPYAGPVYIIIYNKMYTACVRRVDVTHEPIDFPDGNLKTNSSGVGTCTGGATVARAAARYTYYAHRILFCVCNYYRAWGITGMDI